MILEARNLSFSYRIHPVFHGVSFAVGPGEMLALLGANGVGKTTLLKVLLGLYGSTSGHVCLDGHTINDWSRSKIAHFVGYVPQNHVPPFPFSVTDVVLMGRTAHIRAYHSPTREDIRIALEAMGKLHIEHLKDRSYTEISGGERQLALIARALAQEPKVLVMDEPTANLDFGNQVRILRYIRQLAESGLAILMSSHYPEHALQYATKVALMKDGSIGTIAPPKEAITESKMHELYGIDVAITKIPLSNERSIPVCVAY